MPYTGKIQKRAKSHLMECSNDDTQHNKTYAPYKKVFNAPVVDCKVQLSVIVSPHICTVSDPPGDVNV